MIDRQQAFILIKRYIKNENLIQQSLMVETILGKIAKKLGKNEEMWRLTGLLHNIDYEYTIEEPEKRGIFAAQLLEGLLPEISVNAIKSMNYQYSDYVPSTSLDKSLVATAAISDFIISIVNSSKTESISEINISMILNKLNDSNFINVNLRNRILLCNDVGIDLKEFLKIGINTYIEISD